MIKLRMITTRHFINEPELNDYLFQMAESHPFGSDFWLNKIPKVNYERINKTKITTHLEIKEINKDD